MALTEGMVRSLLAEMAKYLYAADMAFDRRSGQILVAGMAKSIYLYAAVVAFDRMVNRSVADRARVDFVRAT